MSQETGYAFDDRLPIEPITPGSTVLVAGPALSDAETLSRLMVVSGTEAGEGALLISTGMTCTKLIANCRRTYPSLDAARIGIIDCSGQEIGQDDLESEVRYVSTQSDLTGIGMKFSSLYETLYPQVAEGRIRTGLISLSSLSMYVEMRTLFQFTQTLTGRIDSADGLGVFAIDPTTHDTKTVNTLGQAVDGRIDVRETEDGENQLRIRGLPDQPEGWQPFSL